MIRRYLWEQIQVRPFKVGIVSSASSMATYFLHFLTDETVMRAGAFFAMILGLLLTTLSIWLTVIRIRKETVKPRV